jgi:hypothetical protein
MFCGLFSMEVPNPKGDCSSVSMNFTVGDERLFEDEESMVSNRKLRSFCEASWFTGSLNPIYDTHQGWIVLNERLPYP